MKQNKSIGIVCGIGAAFIYGIMPILAKMTYMGGSNTITVTLFRSIMSIPILLIILKIRKVSLKVTLPELGKLIVLGLLSVCITGLLLYGSYNFLSVGLATTIHYVYPVIVTLLCILLFHDAISRMKLLALALSMCGILMFFKGEGNVSLLGIGMAFLSGITYSIYLVVMDKSGIKGMDPFKISLYCCLTATVFLFIYGTATDVIAYHITPRAWVETAVLAVLVAVIANTLIPIGIRNVGPTVVSILGMFEPIVSVVLGVLLLGEALTVRGVLGCVLIIVAVLLLTVEKDHSKEETLPTNQKENLQEPPEEDPQPGKLS